MRPDPLFVDLDAEARAGRNPRDPAVGFDGRSASIAGFHLSDWRTPTGDVTADRAMIGDGTADDSTQRLNEPPVRTSVIEAPRPTLLSLLWPLGAFALVVAGWFWFTWVTDPLHQPPDPDVCYGGARRANFEIRAAESHQDVSAMASAYADGVAALTICVDDPRRGAGHHRNYVRGLAIAKKAAAEWSRYKHDAQWPSLATPQIVEY